MAGIDEVGRGAWAGPLFVGVVVIGRGCGPLPRGTRDSKALTSRARADLEPRLIAWCAAWALGVSSAAEIDSLGLTSALRLAASRALKASPLTPDAVVVDGPMDFIGDGKQQRPKVLPVVRADQTCGTVSAASVLAKVARDEHMASLANRHPGYGFERHKGYGTAAHVAAVTEFGFTHEHRQSWSFALDHAN